MNGTTRGIRKLYLSLLLCMSVFLVKLSAQTAAENATAPQKVLEITVLDLSSGEPVSGAEVTVRVIQEAGGDIRQTGPTDEKGKYTVPIADKNIAMLRMEAVKNGYVPVQLSLLASQTNQPISTEQTMNLEKGTEIGGKVQDEQGSPIEGVTVSISLQSSNQTETAIISGHEEKTDANGLWLCDIIPEKPDRITIRFSDPNYRAENLRVQAPSPIMQLLREMNHVMVLRKQLNLTGQVLNKAGEPIEGALVAQGANRRTLYYPSTKTDAQGRYTFENVRPGEMVLTVQASGYSPDTIRFIVTRQMSPIVFRLEPGHTVKGRVVDPNGEPVADATVGADTWHEFRSLTWETQTDANGSFVWNDAPEDEVTVNVNKRRYIIVRNFAIKPSEMEYLITLRPELLIQGKVVDANSGEPVNDFRFYPGVEGGAGQDISWKSGFRITKTNDYLMRFTYPSDEYYIRVEAEGYEPEISRPISGAEGSVTLDFKLRRIASITGTVIAPDGKPLAGAEVMIVTSQLRILNGRAQLRPSSDKLSVKTDPAGKFSFFPRTEQYSVVILHDLGYAFVTQEELSSLENIKLTAWAKLDGTLRIGTEPGAKETVTYAPQTVPLLPGVTLDYQAQTDEKGKFVFDRVLAGEGSLSRSLRTRGNLRINTHALRVEALPGQTANVRIGGTGRPVIGKIIIPDEIKDRTNWQYIEGTLNIESADSPYFALSFAPDSDGSFRIDDVPEGKYLLYVQAYDLNSQPQLSNMEQVASLTHPFSVPEMSAGRSDDALELGNFELQITTGVTQSGSLLGNPVPDFENIAADFSKEKMQGKAMLVCFWDYEQRPSRNCIVELNKRANELREKGLEIVAVQISEIERETLDTWLRDNEITLPTGTAGENASKVRYEWGINSLPWLVLADKNHTVIDQGFGTSELDEKIDSLK